MNKVVLIGRLTADPELRETTGGTPVAMFTVAVDRRFRREGGQQADFIRCVAWNKTASFVCDYFRKGKQIALEGRIETRSWEGRDGQRQYATEVVAEAVEFVGPKEQGGKVGGSYPYRGGDPVGQRGTSWDNVVQPEQANTDEYGLTELPDEDDLPF